MNILSKKSHHLPWDYIQAKLFGLLHGCLEKKKLSRWNYIYTNGIYE